MQGTLNQYLATFTNSLDKRAVRVPLENLIDRYSSQAMTSAGLVIHGAASAVAKTGAADFYAVVKGVPILIAAGTDMPALTGLVITAANFNVACFFVDSAAVVTAVFGTQGASLGAIQWPVFPRGKALIGFLIITSGSTFTGGTTALDAATTVYVSPLGAFDPTMTL